MLTVFLGMKRSQDAYIEWMKEQGCKQSNRAEECAQALSEWCRLHLLTDSPKPNRKTKSIP